MMYRLSASFRLLLLLLTSISTASHEVTVESTKSFKVNAKVPGITRSLAFPPRDWFRLQSIVCVLGAGESVRVSIHQQLIRVEGYFVLKLILSSIFPHTPAPETSSSNTEITCCLEVCIVPLDTMDLVLFWGAVFSITSFLSLQQLDQLDFWFLLWHLQANHIFLQISIPFRFSRCIYLGLSSLLCLFEFYL